MAKVIVVAWVVVKTTIFYICSSTVTCKVYLCGVYYFVGMIHLNKPLQHKIQYRLVTQVDHALETYRLIYNTRFNKG